MNHDVPLPANAANVSITFWQEMIINRQKRHS